MPDRPITRHYRGPAAAAAFCPGLGGENLSDLIAEVDILREELGYGRWAHLSPWCDTGDPGTTDRGGLERLIERLAIVVENRASNHTKNMH
jgi:hypothetical protein